LARQKELLLAEAELHRCILATELQRIRHPLNWLKWHRSPSHSWHRLLILGAPIAGFLLSRRRSGIGYWLGRALGGFRIIREVLQLVGASKGHVAEPSKDVRRSGKAHQRGFETEG